jgi:hypothetical protein
MKTKEAKRLLEKYFNGESSVSEERKIQAYFHSAEVADELKPYIKFFKGITGLSCEINNDSIEKEVMDYILENETQDKSKYRWLWRTVTGIAASVILVIGGMLLYQQQDQNYGDTFEKPEAAYACAENTLEYVSSKYNIGLTELSNFDKLQTAAKPLQKGVKPVNAFFENVEKMNND